MSEAMTVELIVESEWMLKKYWTKTRFAYQTESGGWSDVDVLSYHPEKKHLVISESKVRGRKKAIHAYTEHTKENMGQSWNINLLISLLDHTFLKFVQMVLCLQSFQKW